MFPSVAAMSPDFVPAVGRGGVSVQDGVALCQAQSAGVVDAVEGLLFVNYFPVDCIFFILIFQINKICPLVRKIKEDRWAHVK